MGHAVALEAEGVGFARYVQYSILLDRLLRFPITGSRIRNYDGLGGQLLFAFLHRHGYLHWTDNQLTIEWDRVADGVAALRHDVEELYRDGIDRTKLQHWAAAHDLVAASVPPAGGSKWTASVREFTDVEDPRPYVDLVRDEPHVGDHEIELVLPAERDDRPQVGADHEEPKPGQEDHLRVALRKER